MPSPAASTTSAVAAPPPSASSTRHASARGGSSSTTPRSRLRLETAVEALRRDHDVEPAIAEAATLPPLPEGITAPARVRDLERELRLLGPINPLALEEFNELQERHTFLETQLEDVRNTRRELLRVIKAIDQEIQSVFAAAFADVSTHFTQLFTALFPGGTGKLDPHLAGGPARTPASRSRPSRAART